MIHRIALVALWASLAAAAGAAPKVVNPSFEADHFGSFPGSAALNGRKIQGWSYSGGAGLDPSWKDPARRSDPIHAFNDNGIVPDGVQVAVLHGQSTLSQRVEGFEAKKHYRVTYYENARHNARSKEPPILEVTLGGQTIVSPHRIVAVEQTGSRTLPFHLVKSAVFEAPQSGVCELCFKARLDAAVAVLIDKVTIEEVP